MRILFCAVFLLSLAMSGAIAQTPQTADKPVLPGANLTDKDYAELLGKLKKGDTSISFTDLRLAYTKTKGYSYGGPDKAEREKFNKPFREKKFKDALKAAEDYLEKMYVDANAHFVAYNSAKELKDDAKAGFHKNVLLGLLGSIKNGNDGSTAETPYLVISIDEEYTMLRFLGLQFNGQGLNHIGGHTFDVMDVTDPKTGQKGKVYFNIDIVWDAETSLFK